MSRTTPLRQLFLVIGVLVLIAAACSSGSDDASVDAASSTTADAETETTATDTPGATTDGSDETSGEANFDSFRGVTADTIKVGITVPDFEALRAAGVGNYFGDYDVVYQVFIDAINAEGGINGRMIEPYYASFDWLRPETQDSACTQLTEDDEVFIVLQGLLSQNNLCITDLHETLLITDGFQTSDLRDQSGETLWLSVTAVTDAATRILGSAIAESGRLDGKTIAVVANGALDDGAAGEVMRETLEEFGFEANVITTSVDISDEIATDAEIATITERLKADGVDFVFALLGGGNLAEPFLAADFHPELAVDTLDASLGGVLDQASLDGVVSVSDLGDELYLADADFRAECVDVVVAARPELAGEFDRIPTSEEQIAGTKSWAPPTKFACFQLGLLKQIAELAGADLTNASFLAALDQLGTVQLPALGQVSFRSADKWDGQDTFYVQRYNAATGSTELVGDAIIVNR